MDIKEIIESEFGLIVHDIFVLGQGLDKFKKRDTSLKLYKSHYRYLILTD